MELNKQIQLNHSIIKEGITIAVLNGTLSIDSGNVGNINTSILNREYYAKFKEEVQTAIKEFYNQFFAECDTWNALITNTVESDNNINEEIVDDIVEGAVENNGDNESGIDDTDTNLDTTENIE